MDKVAKAAVVGLGAAATAFSTLAIAALKLGGELEQNLGGSEAVFKQFAGTVQTAGAKAFDTMGTSQSNFLATANKMGALFQGAGFDVQKSMTMSTQAMQRAADVASIMGIDTSTAMDAIAGAAKGNFTMMDNLGVAMNDTALKAYAVEKGMSAAGGAFQKFSDEQVDNFRKVAEAQERMLDKSLDKMLSEREKAYDNEYKALVASLNAQEKELDKAFDSELKSFEKLSDERMKLIDREYLERLKLIDAEKYEAIKAIEDEIDGINRQSDEEDKASRDKENNDKRVELQSKLEYAKTDAEREKAIADLAEFEEKIRKDLLKAERQEQIDNLKQQKQDINEEFAAKKDAIKEEFDERKSALKEETEEERSALKEMHSERKDAIKIENEQKKDLLKESQKYELDLMRESNDESLRLLKEQNDEKIKSMKETGGGGMSVDLSQQEKIALAMEMFMDKTAYAAGNYAKENETLAGSLNTAKAALSNFLSGAGSVEDAIDAIGNLGSVVVRNLGEILPRLVDGLKVGFTGLLVKVGEVIPALKPLADGILFLAQNMDKVLAVVIPLTVAIAAYRAVMAISGIITAVTTALNGMTVAQYALNLAMSLNPVGLIVAAIAALVAGIIILWNTNENFRNAIIDAWKAIVEFMEPVLTGIKDFFISTWNSIVDFFEPVMKGIQELVTIVFTKIREVAEQIFNGLREFWNRNGEEITAIFTRIWTGISNFLTGVFNAIKTVVEFVFNAIKAYIIPWLDLMKVSFENAWNTIKNNIQVVFDTIKGIIDGALKIIQGLWDVFAGVFTGDWERVWNGIKEIFSGIWDSIVAILSGAFDIGKNLIIGFWNGINDAKDWLMDKISGFFGGILDDIKDFFGIESPSKVMAQIGKFTAQGFVQGILGMSNAVNAAMESTFGVFEGTDISTSLGRIGGIGSLALAGTGAPSVNNYNMAVNYPAQTPYEAVATAQASFERLRWLSV